MYLSCSVQPVSVLLGGVFSHLHNQHIIVVIGS